MHHAKGYVAAIDQGTTSTRCIIFNRNGEILASHQLEHTQRHLKAGWVEHGPEEIWQKTCLVVERVMEKATITAEQLAAVGITNQRETTLVWDPVTDKPYYPAIVWHDTRTSEICRELSVGGDMDCYREKVGLPLSTYFSGPKIRWILKNVERVRRAAENGRAVFGNMDTWLIWKLTGGCEGNQVTGYETYGGNKGGVHITDHTNASRTMLMNMYTLDWDDEMLQTMDIPRGMLPEIRPSSDSSVYGYTTEDGPFHGRVPITAALGDQQAALFGQTCFEIGEAKSTYGTGSFLLLNTGENIVQSNSGLLTTIGYTLDNEKPCYALEGSIAVAGSLVQWLRDNFGLIRGSSEIEELARTVPDNGGVYFVPAFSGLFAPYWHTNARGLIIGLTHYANKGHLARAVLEATAFQTREILEAMEKDARIRLKDLRVDGGMVINQLLMQFQADILGVPVMRPHVTETTALGAAYAAGRAVGFWKNKEEMKQNWKMDKTWKPKMNSADKEALYSSWKKAVTRTFDWLESV